jgi:hypothetical protein
MCRESASDDDSDTESLDGLSPEDTKDESPARIEWLRQKDIEKAENKYLDRLMSLPGLEETKTMFLHAKAKVQAATRRETSLKKENFDVVFTGNEGTGKTTMAHLYAKFLQSLGLVKPAGGYNPIHVVSSYYFGKTSTLETMRNICASCNGCVSSDVPRSKENVANQSRLRSLTTLILLTETMMRISGVSSPGLKS